VQRIATTLQLIRSLQMGAEMMARSTCMYTWRDVVKSKNLQQYFESSTTVTCPIIVMM